MAWNYASLVVLAVSGIGLNVVIAFVYDSATLGAFNQVLASYIVFSMLGAGGINFSVLRALAEHADDRTQCAAILRGALVPTLGLSAVVAGLFWLSAAPLAEWLESAAVESGIRAATTGLFFFALNKVLLGAVNGLRRMRAFAVYQALRYVLILIGLLACIPMGVPGSLLPIVFTFGESVLFVALIIDVSTQLPWWRKCRWRRWSSTHLRFGIKSVLSGVLIELNSRVDILMLGYFLGDSEVGIYSFAALFAEGFFQLTVVLQNNYNPILARHIAEQRLTELAAIVKKARRLTYLLVSAIGLLAVLLYPVALRVLTNKVEFSASHAPFCLLVAGIVAASGYLAFQNVLSMANRPGWHTAFMLMTVLFNGVANWILIPVWGINGAAAATGLTFVFAALLLRTMAWRLVRLRL